VADIAPSSRHSHRSSCSTTCCFSRRWRWHSAHRTTPPTELLRQRLLRRQQLRAHPYTVTRYCRSPDLAS
jgi:hypothetical protein